MIVIVKAKVMRIVLLMLFSMLFVGCGSKTALAPCIVPKLKTCKVSKKNIKVSKKGNTICLSLKAYKILKKQNYRLRVCNELLNRQNLDFNKRFVK